MSPDACLLLPQPQVGLHVCSLHCVARFAWAERTAVHSHSGMNCSSSTLGFCCLALLNVLYVDELRSLQPPPRQSPSAPCCTDERPEPQAAVIAQGNWDGPAPQRPFLSHVSGNPHVWTQYLNEYSDELISRTDFPL